MQNLRDQLLKAGVIDKKKKRHADRESKSERRKKGARTVAAEEQERAAAHEEKLAAQRNEARARDEQKKAERAASESLYRARDLVTKGIVRQGRRGNRRFHFVTRGGRIPFLTISEELALQLERGQVAIVEVPLEPVETFEVVERATANKLGETHGEFVLFVN